MRLGHALPACRNHALLGTNADFIRQRLELLRSALNAAPNALKLRERHRRRIDVQKEKYFCESFSWFRRQDIYLAEAGFLAV